jgi:hypothetical protein
MNNDMQQHGNILMIHCSSTVSKSEQLPEDGQVGPKHLATDVILMLF